LARSRQAATHSLANSMKVLPKAPSSHNNPTA
jgi:hypothetical protein